MKEIKNKKELLEHYMKLPYTIRIIPEKTGGFFAEIEELPGCMTQGDTIEEIMKNIEEAKELWLEVAIEEGIEIPQPKELEEYSGKFLIRIPKSLHKRLAYLAEKDGVSLNQMVIYLLSERIILKEVKNEIKTLAWDLKKVEYGLYTLKAQKFLSGIPAFVKEKTYGKVG